MLADPPRRGHDRLEELHQLRRHPPRRVSQRDARQRAAPLHRHRVQAIPEPPRRHPDARFRRGPQPLLDPLRGPLDPRPGRPCRRLRSPRTHHQVPRPRRRHPLLADRCELLRALLPAVPQQRLVQRRCPPFVQRRRQRQRVAVPPRPARSARDHRRRPGRGAHRLEQYPELPLRPLRQPPLQHHLDHRNQVLRHVGLQRQAAQDQDVQPRPPLRAPDAQQRRSAPHPPAERVAHRRREQLALQVGGVRGELPAHVQTRQAARRLDLVGRELDPVRRRPLVAGALAGREVAQRPERLGQRRPRWLLLPRPRQRDGHRRRPVRRRSPRCERVQADRVDIRRPLPRPLHHRVRPPVHRLRDREGQPSPMVPVVAVQLRRDHALLTDQIELGDVGQRGRPQRRERPQQELPNTVRGGRADELVLGEIGPRPGPVPAPARRQLRGQRGALG